jgi:hypothetical protein
VKHAGGEALARIAPLLDAVRRIAGDALIERKPGTFYRRRDAFLHFHEDPAGLFADLKVQGQWQRCAVGSAGGDAALTRALRRALDETQ